MSQVKINSLFKVNELQAQIKSLNLAVNTLEESLKHKSDHYKNEETLYAKVFKQQVIQEAGLKHQANNLLELRGKEAQYKIQIGQIIENSISNFLTSENINSLISTILSANPGKKSTLTVDPELAKTFNIKNFEAGKKGELKIDFEFNSYILNPEELYSTLRPRLLTKILN